MTSSRCSLCGGFRALHEPEFTMHILSIHHQFRLREWDRNHQQPTHHDGHVALKIPCGCEK